MLLLLLPLLLLLLLLLLLPLLKRHYSGGCYPLSLLQRLLLLQCPLALRLRNADAICAIGDGDAK